MHLDTVVVLVCLFTAALAEDLLDALRGNGAQRFHDAVLRNAPLASQLRKDGGTLFAVQDSVMTPEAGSVESLAYHYVPHTRISLERAELYNTSNHRLIGAGPDGVWSINKTAVDRTVQADNGVLHFLKAPIAVPVTAEETLAALPDATEFLNTLRRFNLSTALVTRATIFAPSNAAMRKVLESDTPTATIALSLHKMMIDRTTQRTLLANSSRVVDKSGNGYTITTERDQVQVNGVHILASDLIYNDGLIHITDGLVQDVADESSPNLNLPEVSPDSAASQTGPAFPWWILAFTYLFFVMQ
ncbi:hypothetical protein BCR43DRAFT_525644 [Syncephalastrum racemosum]|uniref:FAS1 domain-containing protein n=1 Tax=Syncephalastrum racemosum TaxID=13706 RepID=A0A1X2H781_SYNRA|nr:hypothetical protein BCR43DRAFT_525644 [Syncephalastrum racemosum]